VIVVYHFTPLKRNPFLEKSFDFLKVFSSPYKNSVFILLYIVLISVSFAWDALERDSASFYRKIDG